VDESTKRPVNAKAAVALKACQGDLSRANILVSEMARAGVVTTALNKTLPLPGAATANPADPATDAAAGNLVAVVPFGMGSASWSVEQADAAALVRRAKGAAVIMIRGRTDAQGDSLQETALSRRRAEAAAEFLQLAGVPKDKLRLTWQGAGDPVAIGPLRNEHLQDADQAAAQAGHDHGDAERAERRDAVARTLHRRAGERQPMTTRDEMAHGVTVLT